MTRIEHLSSDALLGHLAGRRWFATPSDGPRSAFVSCVVHADDELELALVDVQFANAPDRTYLLALGPEGQDAFEHLPALARLTGLAGIETPCASARSISAEQSNSSVVLDESVVLKLYRRIESGPSPEVELLGALEGAG
jgi:predicted trehalose synthase